MKFSRKLVGLAAAVALVAAPAVVAAPAQAAPKAKVSGTTLVSFKKEYAGIIKLITPIAPAKFIGSKMSFPVTGAKGKTVTHSGGITVGGVPATDPVITTNKKARTATIAFSIAGNSTVLFTVEHWKSKADGKGGSVWQGDLHLTEDATLVATLNQLLGIDTLTPGLGLGQVRTTIKTKK